MALDQQRTGGHPGDEQDGTDEIFADINITPFTDVILVLLIIFMVSSSAMVDAAREGHLDVTLPQAGHAAVEGAAHKPLVIGIAADGRLFVQGHFVDADALGDILRVAHSQDPLSVVIVDADGTVPHKRVVEVIDRVKAAGFGAVGIGAESSP